MSGHHQADQVSRRGTGDRVAARTGAGRRPGRRTGWSLRRIVSGAIAVGVLATALLYTGGASAAQTAVPQLRVMPLGDSITWGSGSATTSSYRAPLAGLVAGQSRYTVQFVGSQSSGSLVDQSNEGHSGYIIDQIRSGIDGWMAAARPDVVTLHIGINDLNRGIDIAGAPGRLADLVNRIYTDQPGVAVIQLGLIPTTPNLTTQVAAYNAAATTLQGTENAVGRTFVYVQPPALTPAEFTDGLHPNDAGYLRMAQALYPALNQVFDQGKVAGERQLDAGTESGGTGPVRWADFDGDGRADYLTVAGNGAVSVWLNRGGDGHGGWSASGQVATGQTADAGRVRFADFDGDGRADYLVLGTNGAVSVWLNRGGDGHGGWSAQGQVATGQTTDPGQVRFADLDGDGRADYTWISPAGAVSAYLNRGGDGHGGWVGLGQVATGVTADATQVSFADFGGDGNADYILGDPATHAATVYQWNGGDGHGGWLGLGRIASGVPIG